MSNESGKKTEMKDVIIHGTQESIEQWGNRLKFVIPGGKDLSPAGAVLTKMYGDSLDANLQRGEIYAWEDYKGLHIVEGYKLLVRWARRQADFFDTEEELTAEEMKARGLDPVEDIAYRVWILREDKLEALGKMVKIMQAAGVPESYKAARSEIAQCAVGAVTKPDRTQKNGNPKDPPVGWTWHDVAIKRALKNALNKAYGIPSPREIADESWRVGDVQTTAEDWEIVESEMPDASQEQRELLAAATALERERKAEFATKSPQEQQAKVEENSQLLFGPDEDDPLGIDTPPIPQEPPPQDGEEDDPEVTGNPPLDLDQEPDEEQGEVVSLALEPYSIRRACRIKAEWVRGTDEGMADAQRLDQEPVNEPIDKKTLVAVQAALNASITGRKTADRDTKRRGIFLYLYGVDSGNGLTNLEGKAILDWLALAGGENAAAEVEGVLLAYQAENGQQELPGV